MSQQPTTAHGDLHIATPLYDFVRNELIPGSGIDADHFWQSLQAIIAGFGPRNKALLQKRDTLQTQIDEWHLARKGQVHDPQAYRLFLQSIGYLVPAPDTTGINTSHVDTEITHTAGPQLVVPLDNVRYVLKAANARWGSLYDALYATDAIAQDNGCEITRKYNPIRGERVIDFGRDFLDRHFALEKGSHYQATHYKVRRGQLIVRLGNGKTTCLLRPERLAGYSGDAQTPDKLLLCKNGLHVELCFGEGLFIGRRDHANIYDIQLESALSAIMDCEDSVAAVDVDDKLVVYRNWLGLMQGSLTHRFKKGGKTIDRVLAKDRQYLDADGKPFSLSGRSLLLVRNVGAHLDTDMVRYKGEPITETLLDVLVTSLAAKHNLPGNKYYPNSRTGSVYIVKPKMHGPQEVALAAELFSTVETALDLPPNTLKMGVMDEERRTSLNLSACIAQVASRVFFINTGFLDRTGDEIHTCMQAGPVIPKEEMKHATWLTAYENNNVNVGLNCGFRHRAQIGKGMWAAPDAMAAMLENKVLHPKAGANTAWVPSPTAATLHALHYHLVDVSARQQYLVKRTRDNLDAMLNLPLLPVDRQLSEDELKRELDNNAQSLLGYVSRWVGQGIGCSKVADINNVQLMEDCATLRISSQHIANWLHHGLYSEQQVRAAMKKMAYLVDTQNNGDPSYRPMSDHTDTSERFQAALDLVFKGLDQPNGYTEYILQARRRNAKAVQFNAG